MNFFDGALDITLGFEEERSGSVGETELEIVSQKVWK